MHDLLHRLAAADDHILRMTAQYGDFADKFIHVLPLFFKFLPQNLPCRYILDIYDETAHLMIAVQSGGSRIDKFPPFIFYERDAVLLLMKGLV